MKYVIYILLLVFIVSCSPQEEEHNATYRQITDATGRTVNVPDSIRKLIALKAGALRLITYLHATEKVIAVEGNEKRRTVPYLYAHPELKELPVTGAGNFAEPELLAAYQPDIIICTYFTKGEADELQQKTGIPVVVVEYGDFNQNREKLYQSLRFLGELLHKQSRADSLITFIKKNIAELHSRTSGNHEQNINKVYVGGIAYRGSHGITSTEPHYAAFSLINADNVAGNLGEVTSSPRAWLENAFIDVEQLINWNPDVIFLDAAGKSIWEEDLKKESLQQSLSAIKDNRLYVVLPHNWYTTNYENILCNAWYVGKILYPQNFEDIDIRTKSNEIYSEFLGKPVYDSMMVKYNVYVRIER